MTTWTATVTDEQVHTLYRVMDLLKFMRQQGMLEYPADLLPNLEALVATVGLDEKSRMAELVRELDAQQDTIQALASGLAGRIDGWKRCALRLRREVLRLDPTNQTESQIDWRLEGKERERV